jgi:ATP-dependent RNA helicase RhlE
MKYLCAAVARAVAFTPEGVFNLGAAASGAALRLPLRDFMKFTDLDLNADILDALDDLGYETPTPIQQQAIPPALEGRDVLGTAQTGTGKTAAFVLPILELLSREPIDSKRPIRTLILTPTRELAIQIDESIRDYGKYVDVRRALIFGGVGQQPQVDALRRGSEMVVATPGRLLDLMQQGHVDLRDLSWFVLDEADRMLDMGFINDVRKVIAKLPRKRQTMFFSATMPFEVLRLSDDLLIDPVRVSVDPVSSTAETIMQQAFFVDTNSKRDLLAHLLKDREEIKSVLVFTRTKHGADRVSNDLERRGIPALAIHGNKSQNARQAALTSFKKGKTRVLVATDIAARGIDIDDLTHVVNMDIPDVAETYVHRIGRTGRAGASGAAFSFIDREEYGNWQAVLKLINVEVPADRDHPFPSVLSSADSFAMVSKGASGGGGPRRPTRPQGRRR